MYIPEYISRRTQRKHLRVLAKRFADHTLTVPQARYLMSLKTDEKKYVERWGNWYTLKPTLIFMLIFAVINFIAFLVKSNIL